jgi:ribosomal-protein-alanine N-acetyltransferase
METRNMPITLYTPRNPLDEPTKVELVDFLHQHLEQYGDPKPHIMGAVNYALDDSSSAGGYVFLAREAGELVGATVVNRTGMKGYIPENILVYIATHREQRGKGLGHAIMREILQAVSGDIALHVEASNPAIKLYEKCGFENPYLEMRLKR